MGDGSGTGNRRRRILTLFGTRPEIIKLAPVIRAMDQAGRTFDTLNVASGQHANILPPFLQELDIRLDYDLGVGRPNQSPTGVASRVLGELEAFLEAQKPDAILVQGDTTTALAGALAGFQARVPVGHVEAGLRSGNSASPFPEEINRRLISQVASFHFAATPHNRDVLIAEGVESDAIVVTGNPVVDSVSWAMDRQEASSQIDEIEAWLGDRKLLLLTTHRRESFGEVMESRMSALANFAEANSDVAVVFPVHPNPQVAKRAQRLLGSSESALLVPPMKYSDFIHLISLSWMIVSDSGGIQEEAPSLGKPVLLIRDNTERPEAIQSGVVRLVAGSGQELRSELDEAYRGSDWVQGVRSIPNPFGEGDSGSRIADALGDFLNGSGDLER
jgi:UDP-N-acetylglucosamine 2-epimerase (non-hydrolysing)